MIERDSLLRAVIDAVTSLLEEQERLHDVGPVGPDTVLVGQGGVLSSLLLVSLLLQMEDFCRDRGLAFVWASDSAMSQKRGAYRTPAALADYIAGLAAGGEG